MRIEYHRTLIADRVRNEAFFAALKSVIEPGRTIVADIGAGTGLLGLMASKLGAKEVYLYETAEVAGIAQKILKANRARNCHLMPCHSSEMQDPPRADVVVSETLGNFALEENIVATIADARARHLKAGGTIVPHAITQRVAPVVASRIHDELMAWDRVGHGLDLSVGKTMSLNNAYVRTFEPQELHEPAGTVWDRVDLTRDGRSQRKGEVSWKPPKPLTVFGFAVWWEAELAPGIVLSTAPGAPATHWEQLYLPLLSPMQAGAGETVSLSLRSRSSEEGGTHIAWTAVRLDKAGKSAERQALDLEKGFLP
jgi:protein arginine N-methyltransferase 1